MIKHSPYQQPNFDMMSLNPNPDKPEITKYKHQMTNKFQITISNYPNPFSISGKGGI